MARTIREINPPATTTENVGYLVSRDDCLVAMCTRCTPTGERLVPLFVVNVYPYKATCDSCHAILVEPRTSAWPDLFGRGTFDERERAVATSIDRAQWHALVAESADVWLPANGGTENVLTYRTGRRLLYVFNPKLSRHAYLDVDSDVVLSDDEAQIALGES